MKVEDIRKLDTTAIEAEISKMSKEIMDLRLGNRIGITENPVELRRVRRTVARMKTILRERELQAG